ncbi:hypothetical protein TOPH_09251 [Tolypocladium ophioglossoides CBS 100239]|uniref:Uncharacterized protein n=1 Tax=Tolypocladium ophioglossoides (strain CBS 100239) TaxID=1163406 RepID=A0A0L0MWG3_TOLOC|nr:hypothetical protein TOPH_09251 [Tolypocladium ophioglossoides CBS 100239]
MHGTRFAGPRSDTSDSLPDTATPSDIVDGAEVDILETGPRSINESADSNIMLVQAIADSFHITGDPTSGNPRVSQIHFEISVTIELGNTRNALALDVFRLERLQLLQDSNSANRSLD